MKHNVCIFLPLPNKRPDLYFDYNSRLCIRGCSKQLPQLLWRKNGSFYRPVKGLYVFTWESLTAADKMFDTKLMVNGVVVMLNNCNFLTTHGAYNLSWGCANSSWTREHRAHPGYFRKQPGWGRMVKFKWLACS